MKEFLRQLSDFLRGGFLVLLVLAASCLAIYRLLMVQIVAEEQSEYKTIPETVYTQVIPATRGRIVDVGGEVLISNKIGYHLIVEKAFFPSNDAEGNAVILKTVQLLKEAGTSWQDTMPISHAKPYAFDPSRSDDADTMKTMLHLNGYATAENCIDKLIDDYKISEDYSDEDKRCIAGVRYEMLLRQFSMSNAFYLANDISLDFVTRIKELRVMLPGINIEEAAVRTVENGDILPHEIGYVGPIYNTEEYKQLLTNGHEDYTLSDTVGKSGLERNCEAELRGINGTRKITVKGGEVSSVEVTNEPVGGHTLQLTVNSGFQRSLQSLLDKFCYTLRTTDKECRNANCGAIVVLDTKDNAVLGMATLPTYDLNELLDNYKAVTERANTPLVNRATDGLYRPGSTFKTITATAGLDTGLISGTSSFYCDETFHYIDTDYHCTSTHYNIAVPRALTVSCNIFFYNLGLKLGLDTLLNYETRYGLGTPLGLESGDSGGYLACPETFEKLGIQWHVGELTQAAIGQSEIQVTPLQMAVVASTIANNGVRYRPHLIDTVWDYAMTRQLSVTQPEIVANVATSGSDIYTYIEQGMVGAAQTAMPAQYDLNNIGVKVAIKTGTPQSPRGTDSFVIGYAPADNPEIAFCCAIEGGKNAKYMVRQILKSYADAYPDSKIGTSMRH